MSCRDWLHVPCSDSPVLSSDFPRLSTYFSRSRWPPGLRRGSEAIPLLGLLVRIPPGAWMPVSCECCVLSGRGPCIGLITHPEEFYLLWCVWVWSWSLDSDRPWHTGGCCGMKKQYLSCHREVTVLLRHSLVHFRRSQCGKLKQNIARMDKKYVGTVMCAFHACVWRVRRTGKYWPLQNPVVTVCTAQWSLYVPHSGHYMYRTVVTVCAAEWSLYVPHSGHCMYRTVVTICTAHWSLYVPHSGHYMYHQFNIHTFYVLPTQCIYVFCVDLRTNSHYFPIQH